MADRGPDAVTAWLPSLRAAVRLGASGPRYVLGFSNGGYFAGLLAVRGWFEAEAFVIANAGPVEPIRALGAKRPLLLVSADEDPSQESMARLDDELTQAGWTHQSHWGAGTHELTDSEIDAALAFLRRVRDHEDPFVPSRWSHRPLPRERQEAADKTAP